MSLEIAFLFAVLVAMVCFFMPLSFGAILGGTTTMVGTPLTIVLLVMLVLLVPVFFPF